MKLSVLFLLIIVSVQHCFSQQLTFDLPSDADLGTVLYGQEKEHNYCFKNSGSQTLIITEAVSISPGFTIKRYPKEILPGHRGCITITHNTAFPGAFSEQIIIHSNDTLQPEKILTLHGTVTERVNEPRIRVNYKPRHDTVVTNSPGDFSIGFTSIGGKPLNIISCEVKGSKITCKIPVKPIRTSLSGSISCKLNTQKPGTFKEKLAVTTDDPQNSKLEFTVIWTVVSKTFKGPDIVFPSLVLYVDTLEYNSNADNFSFGFKNAGNEPLIIASCQSSGGNVICGERPRQPIAPGETGKIGIHIYTRNQGPINKSLTIHTNDPDEPVLILIVKGFITAPTPQPIDEFNGPTPGN